MCQMGFPELKNIIECPEIALANIFNGISHKDRFTISTAYKSGLRSTTLAEKCMCMHMLIHFVLLIAI